MPTKPSKPIVQTIIRQVKESMMNTIIEIHGRQIAWKSPYFDDAT